MGTQGYINVGMGPAHGRCCGLDTNTANPWQASVPTHHICIPMTWGTLSHRTSPSQASLAMGEGALCWSSLREQSAACLTLPVLPEDASGLYFSQDPSPESSDSRMSREKKFLKIGIFQLSWTQTWEQHSQPCRTSSVLQCWVTSTA